MIRRILAAMAALTALTGLSGCIGFYEEREALCPRGDRSAPGWPYCTDRDREPGDAEPLDRPRPL